MGATTTTTEKIGFSDFADKLEEVKTSTTEVVQQLPIDNEVKTTILIYLSYSTLTRSENIYASDKITGTVSSTKKGKIL